jgi:hypothetical protein
VETGGRWCYVALCALEELPEDVSVRRVALVASAFSRGYDLTRALAHVDDVMYLYYSPVDILMSEPATLVLGCNDGVHAVTAGKWGPVQRDNDLYREKLVVRKYDWRWLKYGYLGTHLTSTAPGFLAREVLSPLAP